MPIAIEKTLPLEDLLLHFMRSIHDAETNLCMSLPNILPCVLTIRLKEFIEEEIEEKKKQKERIEGVFALLKQEPAGTSNEMVRYVTNAQNEFMKRQNVHGLSSDRLIVLVSRTITLYLINTYQIAIACSLALNYHEVTRILRRSLLAEKEMEFKLKILEETRGSFAEAAAT